MGKPLKYLFTLGIPLALAGLGFIYMLAPRGKFEEAILYETVPVDRKSTRLNSSHT